MEKRELVKSDGRKQILYSHRPISPHIAAPSPEKAPLPKRSHFRYNPLLREWVVYAGHRQNRTFLPPPEYNPLAVMQDPKQPTEMPEGDYDVSIFENLFPSLTMSDGEIPPSIVPTRASAGVCEVVVFTQDSKSSLGELPLERIELILEALGDRTRELGKRYDVDYVFVFENRGVEVGTTIHHPHGQIYGYPFIPPIAETELNAQREYYLKNQRGLLSDHIQNELKDGRRILYSGSLAVAFVPVFARYAYEVWVAPVRAAQSFADLDLDERSDLARALKTVLLKYDKLWNKPFPYVMAWHQAPTDGVSHPETHLHAEFYPPFRMPGRLKYLAGSEIGAGVFTADTMPEEKAAELQKVQVTLE